MGALQTLCGGPASNADAHHTHSGLGGGGGNGVVAVVDFGADSDFATATVTGQTWVTAGSKIAATLGAATSDHDLEDGVLEDISVAVGNLVAGVGFDIFAHAPSGSWGQYSVNCVGV